MTKSQQVRISTACCTESAGQGVGIPGIGSLSHLYVRCTLVLPNVQFEMTVRIATVLNRV